MPLLEAMRHDVPVVALAAAAVPDTVGPAAVLLEQSTPALVAASVHQLLADEPFQQSLVAAGRGVAGRPRPGPVGCHVRRHRAQAPGAGG